MYNNTGALADLKYITALDKRQMIFVQINKKLLLMKIHYFVGIGGKNIYENILRGVCYICYDLGNIFESLVVFVYVSNITWNFTSLCKLMIIFNLIELSR